MIAGYLLAGGASRRFGSDKARATVRGIPLLAHTAAALGRRYPRPTVVSAPGRDYSDLDLRTIFDERPDLGPLGGLHAALLDAVERGFDTVALAPCDVLGLNPDWYADLEAGLTGAAAAFRTDRWQPTIGVYRSALIEEVADRLSRRELAMHRLLEDHGVAIDPPDDFATLRRINQPSDLP